MTGWPGLSVNTLRPQGPLQVVLRIDNNIVVLIRMITAISQLPEQSPLSLERQAFTWYSRILAPGKSVPAPMLRCQRGLEIAQEQPFGFSSQALLVPIVQSLGKEGELRL